MIPKQAAFEKRLGTCWQEFSLVWRLHVRISH